MEQFFPVGCINLFQVTTFMSIAPKQKPKTKSKQKKQPLKGYAQTGAHPWALSLNRALDYSKT